MLNIYLARHGQDEDNVKGILNGHRDMPLTDLGISQANEVAQKIQSSKISFDKVYSSPLKRAYKTAEIITDKLNMNKPVILSDLIERDFGIMTGVPLSKIEELCGPNIIKVGDANYFLNPDGAETFPILLERANKVLHELRIKHSDGNILLVAHGDIGKMIYAAFYNLDWQEVLKMFHFGNSELLLLSKDSKPEDSHVFKIKQHNL